MVFSLEHRITEGKGRDRTAPILKKTQGRGEEHSRHISQSKVGRESDEGCRGFISSGPQDKGRSHVKKEPGMERCRHFNIQKQCKGRGGAFASGKWNRLFQEGGRRCNALDSRAPCGPIDWRVEKHSRAASRFVSFLYKT